MNAEIKIIPKTELVGIRKRMSFDQNTTKKLWNSFMPEIQRIPNKKYRLLFSVELYDPGFFSSFNPSSILTQWAAVEVLNRGVSPDGMESLTIPEGRYAVFQYMGHPANAAPFYKKIFTQWLPSSNHILDNRPHLAIMGENYKNNHPDSEEQIWIPVKEREIWNVLTNDQSKSLLICKIYRKITLIS